MRVAGCLYVLLDARAALPSMLEEEDVCRFLGPWAYILESTTFKTLLWWDSHEGAIVACARGRMDMIGF